MSLTPSSTLAAPPHRCVGQSINKRLKDVNSTAPAYLQKLQFHLHGVAYRANSRAVDAFKLPVLSRLSGCIDCFLALLASKVLCKKIQRSGLCQICSCSVVATSVVTVKSMIRVVDMNRQLRVRRFYVLDIR